MPRLLPSQYAKILYKLTSVAPNDDVLQRSIAEFARLLAKDRMIRYLPYIEKEFVAHAKKQQGIVSLTIESTHPLDDEQIREIAKKFGEKTEVSVVINPSCVGGVRIMTDEQIIDATLKHQLNTLKLSLS